MREGEYSLIARAYAPALFRAAQRLATLDAVQGEARQLAQTIEETPKLLVFFCSPQIATEHKLALIQKVYGTRLSLVLINLLNLLVKRERAAHLPEILALLGELIDQSQGIHSASLASGLPLGTEERTQLTQALERYTGSTLRIEWKLEPSLIGGIVFRFRDLLVDGSLRQGLGKLRRRMLGASLAEA